MRLTPLIISAALLLAAPIESALANPWHAAPPGHAKKVQNHDKHEGKKDRRDRREGKRERRGKHQNYAYDKHHRHEKRYARHDYDHDHNRWDKGYYRKKAYHVGHRIDRERFHRGRIVHHDRHHGLITVNIDGHLIRLLENSLEIVQILQHHR